MDARCSKSITDSPVLKCCVPAPICAALAHYERDVVVLTLSDPKIYPVPSDRTYVQ